MRQKGIFLETPAFAQVPKNTNKTTTVYNHYIYNYIYVYTYILELHSPLTNSSGSSPGAKN